LKVIIKAYSVFSDFLGGEVKLVLDKEMITVGELLEYLRNTYRVPGDLKPMVLINGELADLNRVIRDGDVVHIAPSFSGG